jgi:hypothetical protein
VERDENLLEVYKTENNELSCMLSSALVSSYFFLHTTPSIQPLDRSSQQLFVIEPTPKWLLMAALGCLGLDCRVLMFDILRLALISWAIVIKIL